MLVSWPRVSLVTGVTYNFVNPGPDYQNGLDWHLDWAGSQFLTKQLQAGVAGYVYQQLTCDRGAAAFLGGNEARVTRNRSPDRLHRPGGTGASLCHSEGFLGIRRFPKGVRLERMVDAVHVAQRPTPRADAPPAS